MVQIKCSDVSLGYDGKNIVEKLNFEIEQGDYFCIVGSNGSGKTTLMRALLGLKKCSAGEIEYFADKGLGYLPQQSEEIHDFPATVGEVVLSGAIGDISRKFFYGKSERKKARENMSRLGILPLAKKSFSSLSGGQKQRVLLARALCAVDDIILLDEPVSGLDPIATEDMYELISEQNRNHAVTVIMVTHDISAALKYATKILYMGEKPQFFENADDYKDSEVFPHGKEAQND